MNLDLLRRSLFFVVGVVVVVVVEKLLDILGKAKKGVNMEIIARFRFIGLNE